MYNSILIINYIGKIMRSVLIQIFIVIFVAILAWLVWDNWSIISGTDNNQTNNSKAEKPPTAIDAKQVRIDDITVDMEVVGNLKALESIDVTSEVNGIVTEIKFAEGQQVKKENILFS